MNALQVDVAREAVAILLKCDVRAIRYLYEHEPGFRHDVEQLRRLLEASS